MRGSRALHMHAHIMRQPRLARPLDLAQWPGTAQARLRNLQPSQTAREPGVLNEPPSSTPGTPQPTYRGVGALLTA